MSVGGLFNVSSSALQAAYAQLQTTGHNIANVNTPGYNRQEVLLTTAGSDFSGGGFIGRGVNVQTVVRRYDAFLANEVTVNTAASAADSARSAQLDRLQQMFANTDAGIGVALDDLSAAFADVVNRPFDSTARTSVISRSGTLAERISDASASLIQMRETVDQRLMQSTQTLNSTLQQLAQVNNQIARAFGSGQTPNDLLDQRDLLVEQVNKTLKTTSYVNRDGTVSLFSAAGQGLVVGDAVARFSVANDSMDPSRLQLTLSTSGNNVAIPSTMLGGGELAGLLRFRDEDLQSAATRLGQLAASVAWSYNQQQAVGRDANNAPGAPLFTIGPPVVASALTNGGNADFSVSVVDGEQLAASDYRIAYDGTDYTITRLSDGNATTVSGWPQTLDGLSFNLSGGAAQAGDSFLVRAGSAYASGFGASLSSPARIATGFAMTPVGGAANAGDVGVRAFSVDANDANLTQPVTITFDGAGTFSVSGTGTGDPGGLAYTAGMTISYNGWSMQLSGTPQPGDSITVVPTPNPATDNRNARAMLGLADAGMVDGRRFTDAFAELLSDVGLRSQSAQGSAALSGQVLKDAQLARAAESGVNLDEEAARLLQFQQAYQAAARLLQTAQTIFEEILRSGGG